MEEKSSIVVNDKGDVFDSKEINDYIDKRREMLISYIFKSGMVKVSDFLDISARHGLDIRKYHFDHLKDADK